MDMEYKMKNNDQGLFLLESDEDLPNFLKYVFTIGFILCLFFAITTHNIFAGVGSIAFFNATGYSWSVHFSNHLKRKKQYEIFQKN